MTPRLVVGAVGSLVTIGAAGGLGAMLATGQGRDLAMPPAAYVAAPAAPAPTGTAQATADTGGPVVAPRWLARTSARAGIPAPALRAYAVAELRVADDCSVGWATLAGIGWVESQHGTTGGRTLLEDGHSSAPILGPALDGAGAVAAIPASPESALLHSDPDWDHAVGPMQFITATWTRWASDGDGDGVADPYDLDDAAYAAARYLCASGADLTTGDGWDRAVLSYNHSERYVDAVRAAAAAYADRTR